MFWDKISVPTKLDLDLLVDGPSSALTPDLWKLEQTEYQLLFVPDQFMSRHPLHNVISQYIYQNKPLISGFTEESYWGFWKFKAGKGSFPVALVNQNKHETFRNRFGRIKGEVVALRPYMFRYLDNYYQNRVEFVRHRTNIVVPYRKKRITNIGTMLTHEHTQVLRCWFYIGKPNYWLDMLDGGQNFCPVSIWEQKDHTDGRWPAGKYFYWSLNEYEDDK